jgi:hypothetical protein
MLSRNSQGMVSSGLVGCMVVVGLGELAHGTPVGEIHLVPAASLATGTAGTTVTLTLGTLSGVSYFDNTIIEALYRAPSDSSPLPHNGVTVPKIEPPKT